MRVRIIEIGIKEGVDIILEDHKTLNFSIKCEVAWLKIKDGDMFVSIAHPFKIDRDVLGFTVVKI